MSYGGADAVMSERPSYSWENRQYLLKVIMNQLGITEEDLEKEPSYIKAKVREMRLDTLLQN
jgi:hypothetical protein